MTSTLQQVIVTLSAAGAAVFVVRRVTLALRKRAEPAACESCPIAQIPQPDPTASVKATAVRRSFTRRRKVRPTTARRADL